MAKISSDKLIIRCYGEKKGNKWIGVCLDFNLATEANSSDELVRKMSEIIKSYIETVLATKDKGSIPALLSRKAPLRDWFKYYFIHIVIFVKDFHKFITFEEAINNPLPA